MPAEWEEHEATWLSWPKDPSTFPPAILPSVERAYVSMIENLSRGEEVRVLVDDEKEMARARSMLKRTERVSFRTQKTVDVWVRDYGPIGLAGPRPAVVKWRFNAWGNKYEDLLPDDESGEAIARSAGSEVFKPGVVLEGGSIDVNGRGLLATTEQCLLNPNRNPGLSRQDVEGLLRGYLGATHTIWLKAGIEGDDTDGHVDDVARFVGIRRMVVAEEDNPPDRNSVVLHQNKKVLEKASDQDGKQLEIEGIPMPPVFSGPEGRLPASHLNFYIANECVLVPTFAGNSDRAALRTLEGAFPKRRVVGIDCRTLVHGLGTIHCVTQQVPASR